ncbi:hypothetical protein ABZW50_03250 [Streptomyces bacillaris]
MDTEGLGGIAAIVVGGIVSITVALISRSRGADPDPGGGTAGALEAVAEVSAHRLRVLRALQRYVRQLRARLLDLGETPPDPADPTDAALIRGAEDA